jgi:alcohol dehydrogenase class IV
MRFEFATATEILFGAGTHREVAERVSRLGRRVFLVTGRDAARAAVVTAPLADAVVDRYTLAHEPTIEDARAASALARASDADVVLSVGGGSVIDLGKAVAALLANLGDPLEYVEVIGRGRMLAHRSLPFVAVPTTAGTGTEVTRNAVLASPSDGVKVSMRSPHMLARLAIVDPELTRHLPPHLTASTGMDALTQLLEPFVSIRATPLVDALCADGLTRAARALPRAFSNGADAAAREDMALASLFGGLALANAGLGIVHGVAAAVGGRYHAPHGAVCAAVLPGAVAVNLEALATRAPAAAGTERYAAAARVLTGTPDADALVTWLTTLRRTLGIPGLSAHGVTSAEVPALAAAAARASSTMANPVVLTDDEIRAVIERAL